MQTAIFATQPRHWFNFDPLSCQWCTDFNHAIEVMKQATLQEEPVAIWRISDAPGAKPIKWI